MKGTLWATCVFLVGFLVIHFTEGGNLPELSYQHHFLTFVKKYEKSYEPYELGHRYKIFKSNLEKILEHNSKSTTFKMAMNQFGDLSQEEFKKYYLGLSKSALESKKSVKKDTSDFEKMKESIQTIPDTLDWRERGAVTGVKDQGMCGSCWAFSTTGAIEGCHFLAKKELVSLSEQNLLDCSWEYGNQGCMGGLMDLAMDYVIHNEGIATEESYPYKATAEYYCKYEDATKGADIYSYVDIPSGEEKELLNAVLLGPVSVAIDASQMSFQFYDSGVYKEENCSPTVLDHGVLLVGYGIEDGEEYWLVKNSWSEEWGLGGFIKIAKNQRNMCGIATQASLPKCT